MIKPHETKWIRALGIKCLPSLARLFMRGRLANIPRLAELSFAMLQGKGCGTGWDMNSEIHAALNCIQSPSPILVDVGANVGTWTLRMLERIQQPGRVLLIEPSPSCHEQLASLNIPNAKLIRTAASDIPGEAILRSPGPRSGISSLHERRDSYFRHLTFAESKIEVSTLDAILDEHEVKQVDFMKLGG